MKTRKNFVAVTIIIALFVCCAVTVSARLQRDQVSWSAGTISAHGYLWDQNLTIFNSETTASTPTLIQSQLIIRYSDMSRPTYETTLSTGTFKTIANPSGDIFNANGIHIVYDNNGNRTSRETYYTW